MEASRDRTRQTAPNAGGFAMSKDETKGATDLKEMISRYLTRHQHPANLWLHVVALPMTFLVPVALLAAGKAWWALASFVLGYVLQFLGHAIEGNDAGETIVVKRLLGRPYVAVIPRREEQNSES
jgi:hypothetical protein